MSELSNKEAESRVCDTEYHALRFVLELARRIIQRMEAKREAHVAIHVHTSPNSQLHSPNQQQLND